MALAAKGFGKLGASSADGSDEREVSGAQTIVSAQEKPSFFPSDFTSAALDAREPYDFEIDHPLTVLSDTLLKRLTRMRRYAMLGLPQSRALNAEAVAQWFNGMAAQELALSAHENKIVQNITWHVKRATGFGGSESGTLVMGSRGAFMPFSSPRSIVSEKLFMIMPQSDGFDLKRGRLLEPVARQLFEVEHPELRRADDLIKLMKDYRHSACPSMIGNPDDIFRSDDGSILIPDYKCPRPREKFKAKPTLRGNDGETLADDDVQWYAYVCQLHHYRELLIDAMRANGLYVPYVAMSLVQFNAWNGDVIVDRIPHDPGIDIEIKACHETFWHNVVSASLPRFSERQRVTEALDLNGDEARAQQLSEERCLWSKIADEAKDKADACRDELMEIVGKYTVPGGKLSIGPVNQRGCGADGIGSLRR